MVLNPTVAEPGRGGRKPSVLFGGLWDSGAWKDLDSSVTTLFPALESIDSWEHRE